MTFLPSECSNVQSVVHRLDAAPIKTHAFTEHDQLDGKNNNNKATGRWREIHGNIWCFMDIHITSIPEVYSFFYPFMLLTHGSKRSFITVNDKYL